MYLSEWADIMLGQWEWVGSVVKVVDSDDVLGVISAVNLSQHRVRVNITLSLPPLSPLDARTRSHTHRPHWSILLMWVRVVTGCRCAAA